MVDGNGFQGKEGQQVPEMTPEIVILSANATWNCSSTSPAKNL